METMGAVHCKYVSIVDVARNAGYVAITTICFVSKCTWIYGTAA